MKKSLSRRAISILTVCLVTTIVLGVFGVSTDRTRAAGFYATIRTWLAPSQVKEAAAGTTGPTDYATVKADAINAGTNQVTADGNAPTATVTTNGGSGLAGSYPDLATAITALNAATITSPVVITVSGTETTPAGGYNITQLGGTSTNTIVIDGGSATTITAFTPQVAGSAASSFDAIFKIAGGDYITIQGFSMAENVGNVGTTPGTTNTMTEFGVLLVHASATDGAQNNTIQNNIITLNSTYTNSVGIFSTSASSTANASQDATSTAGTNSNNKFYGNTISNVAQGIVFICPPITATVLETGNDVGGTSASTANSVTFGNATASSGPWNRSQSTVQAGIYFRNGAGNNIRFNTVTSSSAAYVGSGGLNGIMISSGTAPTGVTYTSTISDNTVIITSTGVALMTGIDFGHGISTGTIVSSNNAVTVNQSATAADAAAVIGIKANYACAAGTLNTNTITVNQAFAPTVTATNSSAVTALTVPGGTTGTPTVNALGNTILINRSTNAATGVTATMSGAQIGIQATVATTTMNIGAAGAGNSNAITIKEAVAGVGTSTYSSAVTYITANAAHSTVNVVNNTLNTTSSTIRSTGALIGVFQDSTVTTLVNVSNNTMNVDRVAASGSIIFQSTSGSPSEVKDIVSNNNITFTSLAGTTTATAISSLGGPGSPAVNNKSINTNTINISGTHSGTTIGITCAFTNTGFIQDNSVTVSSAAATVTGITTSGTVMTLSGNTLNLSSSATVPTAMTGINESGTGAHSITNNTFSAMNFTGIITASPTISGIAVSGNSSANLFGNTITNISVGAATSTASPIVDGVLISGGTSISVFKNKIYGITTAATGATTIVSGIRLSAGTANSVFNNLVGNLTAGAATNPDSIRGINITSTTTSSSNGIFYNTVFLTGGGGTNFGSTGIFHAASSTSTTATLNLRNNIIVNGTTPNGTGLAVAYRRSSGTAGTLANYASTSNNNDFFAGTPGVSNLIYSDGTSSAQTIAAYKAGAFTAGTIAPRDSATFSESPNFLSTSGASANFLHIDPAIATQIESGASAVAGITDDYDGNTRNVSTPDVGADEFAGIPIDLSPPVISYTPFGNGAAVATRTVTGITITDATGVNTTAGTKPRVYYKKSTDTNDLAATGWKFVEADNASSPFTFTISYAALNAGSVSVGDIVQYFIVAQDTVTPNPNVGINSGSFAVAPSSVALTSSAFPIGGTINSYNIVPGYSGTKTVCASGCDYATLTGATGIFNAINTGILTGNLRVEINGDLTVGEDGSVGLNAPAEEPAGSNFTIKIYPTGGARAITGTNAGALIRLNAADRVTIDGSIGGTGTDRSLTITNTNVGTSSAVVWMQSNVADGATSNTIKNLNVAGSGNTQTLFGIGSGSSTISTSSLGTGNNGNTIQNNNISKTQYGIYSQGASAASKNTGNVITQNLMNTASPNNVAKGGIQVGFESGIQITQNNISGITQSSSPDVFGIALGLTSISTTTFTGNEVTGANVSRNFIGTVTNTGTFSAVGISVASATSGTTLIANNSIFGVGANGTSGDFGTGIFLGGGTGSTTQVYFNSVSMTGTFTGGSYPNYGLAIGGTDPTVDVKDNIFYNTLVNGTGVSFAIGTASATFANLTSNYNDFFVTAGGGTFKIGKTGSLSQGTGVEQTLLSDWITATGKDTPNTISVNPQFNSTTNLQPQTGSAVLDAGTSLTGPVSPYVDITGATRVDPPSMGAYEIAIDTSAPVISYTPLANTTSNANRALSSVVVTDGTGVNTTAGTRPRIYYKKSTEANAFVGNTSADNGWKFVETTDTGSPFSFTLDYSLLTSAVVTGDVIQYFVVAQDTAAPANVGINSGTFATAPASVNLGAAQAPIGGTINSYVIGLPYTGSLNVGTGETITSLTNAGGLFQTINNGVLTGNLTINITSDLTVETGAIFLNQIAEEGLGGYTLTIKPSGSARTISGTSTGGGLIVFNGADRVVIDGSLTGGTDRSLTITNGNAGGTVIWIASASASNGANNNTIKNCTISGNTGIIPVGGILAGSGVTLGNDAEAANSNNTIQNNAIFRAQNALFIRGNATTLDQNWMVTGNTFGSTLAADKLIFRGTLIGNAQSLAISGNTINGVSSTTSTSSTMSGIVAALKISGGTISGNKISDIKQNNSTGWGSNGIYLAASTTTSNLTVSNNFISDVASQGFNGVTSSDNGYGIMIDSGGGYNIYHNSVNLNTNQVSAGSITAALNIASAVTTSGLTDLRHDSTGPERRSTPAKPGAPAVGSIDLRDNILVDAQTVGTRYGVYDASTSGAAVFAAIDFNDYFAQNVGFLTSARATLADWQTATGQDASSKAVDPVFVSSTDLHLQPTSPVLSMGTALGTVTNDFDNDPRPASNPDIGADELVQAVAGTIPAGTFYNAMTADGDSLGGNVSITNIIYLNGKLSTGANTLAIGCNASVSGGGASNYVIGNLKKTYCTIGSKSFEVGTANGFSPVTVNVTAGTFPADFTTKAVQGAQPNLAVPAKALSRYWTLTATGVTADLTFSYLDPPDVPGTATEGNFVIFKYNGSFSMPGGTVDTMANTATITGVTSFSDWTLAEPSAEPCPISIAPTSQNFTSAGGSNSFAVTADGSCNWVPVSNNAFITIDSVTAPSGGHLGNGTVNYSVAANLGPARMGTITIGGLTFTVTQNSGCSFMLSSTSQNFVAAGGMDSVNVTSVSGCMWTAVSNDGFITINSGTPGSGNGTVSYTVAANTGPARMGTMTIAGMTFTVTQNSGCTFMLTPTSQNFVAAGGMNSVGVTSVSGCAWTAVSNDAFITVNSGTPGSGNGTVNYTVAANTGPARMGTMTIAGITFNVTQDSGCTFMLTPTSQNFPAPGGSNSVSVTQTTSCSWTAVSNDAFIIIDSGTPGSGNGTVGYHVTANTGPMRSGTMTIAGITFNVTQDAACAFNLSSLSQHFVSTGGMDSVNVITGTGCTWTAVSNDAFITVTMGSSGSGNGTVNYTVAANVGPARMGTMTIAGITFTVSQDSGCMFTLSRNHQSFPGNGGSGSVNVIASDAGCPWTASTTATYIHITSGTPGTGNGALQYTVDANPGPGIRSDTVTIAGQTYTVYQGIDFLDVPSNDLFYTDIGKLAARGVTLGCGSGNYCPNDSVLREQMAAFILRAKGEFNPPTPASQRFTDVPPANVFYNFIDRLAVLGITVGCNPPTNDMYCPGSAVTREQMSAFILRGLGEFSPPTPASQRFNDVLPANVFYNFIDRMAVLNITLGCTPDHLLYCPSDPVTRAQMAAFLVRAFDL